MSKIVLLIFQSGKNRRFIIWCDEIYYQIGCLSQSKGKILIMIKSLLYKWVYTNIVCSMCD